MNSDHNDSSMPFNVMEEQAHIDKQLMEQAKVRIIKKVHEEEAIVDVSARSELVKIEKIPVNKYVETAPQIRYDGDTMIVPVVREVVIVEKRLLLVEEVHITKKTVINEAEKSVPLRREEVFVERTTTER